MDSANTSMFPPDTPVPPDATRLSLLETYPRAYTDFWRGVGTPPCIYKSGPEWPPLLNKLGWTMSREARPIGLHAIVPAWDDILHDLELALDSLHIQLTSINAFAFANEGESIPFCDLLVYVTVVPLSLGFNDAVSASSRVKDVLGQAGFPELDVAFVEAVVSPHSPRKLLSGNLDTREASHVLAALKPFNTILGAPISPLSRPHVTGSAGLVVRIENQPVLTTCAHVVLQAPERPPPPVRDGPGVPGPEEFVLLGADQFNTAVMCMDHSIRVDTGEMRALQQQLESTGSDTAEERVRTQVHFDDARRRLDAVEALRHEVTQSFMSEGNRVVGTALFAQAESTTSWENDWGLIALHQDQIDTSSANRIFLGTRSDCESLQTLFAQSNWNHPKDGYLRASGVVLQSDIQKPPHVDSNGKPCLFVVKNGAATGLTIGRANTVASAVRVYGCTGWPQGHSAREIAVLPYGGCHEFSTFGDSGAIVLDINGRIVSHVTSGIDKSGVSFTTPYWLIEKQIRARFPTYSRYDSDN